MCVPSGKRRLTWPHPAAGRPAEPHERQERAALSPVPSLCMAGLEALACQKLRERLEQPMGCIGQLAAESSRAAQLKRIRVSVEYPMRTSAVKLVVRRVVVLCRTYLLYG